MSELRFTSARKGRFYTVKPNGREIALGIIPVTKPNSKGVDKPYIVKQKIRIPAVYKGIVDDFDTVAYEYRLIKNIRSPFVIKMKGISDDGKSILMEKGFSYSIGQLCRFFRTKPSILKKLAWDYLRGLQALYKQDIHPHDLHIGNAVLGFDGNLKLIDHSLATYSEKDVMMDQRMPDYLRCMPLDAVDVILEYIPKPYSILKERDEIKQWLTAIEVYNEPNASKKSFLQFVDNLTNIIDQGNLGQFATCQDVLDELFRVDPQAKQQHFPRKTK